MIAAAWLAIRTVVAPWLSATWLRILIPVAAVALIGLAGWRVHTWHESHKALRATETALAASTADLQQCTDSQTAAALAYAEAAGKAESIAAADRLAAEETQRELEARLAAADTGARDLARRLRDYQARRCRSTVPAAADAGPRPTGATAEPGDGEAVERAVAEHLSACAADATRLQGWQDWWGRVRENREMGRDSVAP